MLMWYSPHLIVIMILGLGGGVSISIIELAALEHNIMFDLILPCRSFKALTLLCG